MSQRVVLAIVLSVMLMLGYSFLRPPVQPKTPAPPPPPAAPPDAPPANGAPAAPPVESHPAREETLVGPRMTAVLSSAGGGTLRSADLWTCPSHASGDRSVAGDPGNFTVAVPGRPGALAVDVVGGQPFGLATMHWKLDPVERGVRATIARHGLRLEKTVRLTSDEYLSVVDVVLTNESASPADERILSLHGPWMPHATLFIPEDGIVLAETGEDPEQLVPMSLHEEVAANPSYELLTASGWRYVGVRCDFHLGALTWESLPKGTAVRFDTGLLPPPKEAPPGAPGVPTAAPVLRIPFRVPAVGESVRWSFRLYAGPNSRTILGAEGSPYAALEDAFPNRKFPSSSWGISFRPIANALAWLLDKLAGLGMGYGLAVCALTILVRGALFPLSRKSQVSMRLHAQRMGRLKPKIDAIKEKHKDPRKQQELTMKLMRDEKVSLLPSGCFLAFLQLPIWISLYATLQTAFEMRHASFLWIQDLTAADHLVEMPFARSWPIIGGWFNLLPLLMMATWMISSWMQPLPDDPQQASTAKMMRWMPLLFGVFLYGTAAGLTLYMTLSAVWSIGETWLIRKVWLSKIELAPAKS